MTNCRYSVGSFTPSRPSIAATSDSVNALPSRYRCELAPKAVHALSSSCKRASLSRIRLKVVVWASMYIDHILRDSIIRIRHCIIAATSLRSGSCLVVYPFIHYRRFTAVHGRPGKLARMSHNVAYEPTAGWPFDRAPDRVEIVMGTKDTAAIPTAK